MQRALRQAAAFYGWLLLVSAVFDLGVYKLPVAGWAEVGLQVLAYAVSIAPVLIWSTRTFRTLAMPPGQALVGAVLVAAAVAEAVLVQHLTATALAQTVVKFAAAAIGEEVAFRGFIWERTISAGLTAPWLVVVNAVAFAAWHLVALAAGTVEASGLIGVAVLGIVVSLARLWSGNTGLPALLHLASDIAGV